MKWTLLTLSFLVSVLAHAQSAVLGQATYGGTGCPGGTAHFVFSPDHTKASLMMDAFDVQSGHLVATQIKRKTCSLALPVQVMDGYQIALSTEVVGTAEVRGTGTVTFKEEIFTSGSRGPVIKRLVRSPFLISSAEYLTSSAAWSACGGSAILRANISLLSQREALASVNEIRIKPLIRRCK